MKGTLSDQPLAELIREISSRNFSGTLRLEYDRAQAAIYFESGRVIFAASNIRSLRLAEYLLRNDSTWTHDKIVQAMNSGKETTVTLQKTVPVFIAYFTAWVDRKGRINFRKDIYGHDARMAKVMFSNPSL